MSRFGEQRTRLGRAFRNFFIEDVPGGLHVPNTKDRWARRATNVYDDPVSQALSGPGLNGTVVHDDRRRHVIFASIAASVAPWLLLGVFVPEMAKSMAADGHGVRVVQSLRDEGLIGLVLWVTLATNAGWAVLSWQTSRGEDETYHAPFLDGTEGEGRVINGLIVASLAVAGIGLILLVLLVVAQLINAFVGLVVLVLQALFFIAVIWFVIRRALGRR